MAITARVDDGVVVLGNFSRLMNDPRHVDAGRDVRALLDEGHRAFVLDLSGLRDVGPAGLGLLTTITRLIRQHHGDAVLANPTREVAAYLDEMRMDAYWEAFDTLDGAKEFLRKGHNGGETVPE
jgi:anti-anti-sigma regulatory factor